ncbi:MAG: septum formation initiator family protein [Alphaproteobacteria bacterium]|nr:septum formation initiator family protein [Alphaproteobacteria bacterium]
MHPMNFKSRNLQRLSQKAAAPFMALSVVGYFIYHSIQGDRGILAWVQLQDHLAQSLSQLSAVIKERQDLEERVQALRPESINRDLLDQQVRLNLGYSHPDEIVILRIDKAIQK